MLLHHKLYQMHENSCVMV